MNGICVSGGLRAPEILSKLDSEMVADAMMNLGRRAADRNSQVGVR